MKIIFQIKMKVCFMLLLNINFYKTPHVYLHKFTIYRFIFIINLLMFRFEVI